MKAPGHDQVGRVGDMEIAENERFHHAARRWQSIGQMAVAVLVLAGGVGLFGDGLLGDARETDASGKLAVTHPRFLRADSRNTMLFEVGADLAREQTLSLWIETSLLEHVHIEHINPQPRASEIDRDRLVYHFAVAGLPAPARVMFQLRTQSAGIGRGQVGVGNGPRVDLVHFIYP